MTLVTGGCAGSVSAAAPTASPVLQPNFCANISWNETTSGGAPPAPASVPVSRERILSHFDARAGTAQPRARAEDVRMDVERLPPPPNTHT